MEELMKAAADASLSAEVRLAAAEKLKKLLAKALIEKKTKSPKRYNNLGARLKYMRKFHKFSQKELAELVGVSSVTISLWETGKTEPRKKHWQVLKDLLPEL